MTDSEAPSIQQTIQNLAAQFSLGEDVGAGLDAINQDLESLNNWAHSNDDVLTNFFLAVHEREVFLVDEDITDYFDLDDLRNRDDRGALSFIESRLEQCGDDCPAFHYVNLNGVTLTLISHSIGQAGVEFGCLEIFQSVQEFREDLVAQGYLFTDMEENTDLDNLLIRYRALIRSRMDPSFYKSPRRNLIESADADEIDDAVGNLCRAISDIETWNGEKKRKSLELVKLVSDENYKVFEGDVRTYGLGWIGESVLLDVEEKQRGHLQEFRGRKIRIVCVGTGRYRRKYAAKQV